MKVTSLFSNYLFVKGYLELPGIGRLTVNKQNAGTHDSSKQRTVVLDGISFEETHIANFSPEFIDFISIHSGKMKSLTISDLESHIEESIQMINIGKPYILENIGVINRLNRKEYTFTPATIHLDTLKQLSEELVVPVKKNLEEAEDIREKSFEKSHFSKPAVKVAAKTWYSIAGIILVGILAYAAYVYYQKKKEETPDIIPQQTGQPITPAPDTNANNTITPDTLTSTYKVVLEIMTQPRADTRFARLKNSNWPVEMETTDSVNFKMYINFPKSRIDTAHIVDSLSRLSGKKVFIEY